MLVAVFFALAIGFRNLMADQISPLGPVRKDDLPCVQRSGRCAGAPGVGSNMCMKTTP